MEQKYETISELMKAWMDRHHKNGYKHFIYDGIVQEELFAGLPLRICYVLKECYLSESKKQDDVQDSIAYHNDPNNYKVGSHHWVKYINEDDGDYTYDLIKNIDNEPNWYMWHRVEHLTKILWEAYLSQEETDDIQTRKYNNRISVVDLKKSNGKGESDYKDILKYVSEDLDLLLQEMEIINANVIFFGGTFEISKQAGLISEAELELLDTFDVSTGFRAAYAYKDKILIDAYHPTARGISYEKNDEVIPYFADIFKNRVK